MKVALLTDTHFGARSDNLSFDHYFAKFYKEIFFPTLEQHDIHNIVHLGDLFDRRKYINYLTLHNCKKYFFDQLVKKNIKMDVIVGNHDVFYKNTNTVNSPTLLLSEYSNINIIDSPQEWKIGECNLLLLPWICADNYKETMRLIQTTIANIVFGHLELAGFQMYKGQINEGGFDSKIFNRFELVCSGHFHHKSTEGNITYLGNPYQITWSDYDDQRGFHLFDTDTHELTFIENPHQIFHKIIYDDLNKTYEDTCYIHTDFSYLKNCYVKVIVKNKEIPGWFDVLIDRLEKTHVADLQVVDDHLNLNLEDDSDIVSGAEDTLTILSKFCEQFDTKVDKARLENLLKSLYNEAINLDIA